MINVEQLMRDSERAANDRLRIQSAPIVGAKASPMLTQANASAGLDFGTNAQDKVADATKPITLVSTSDLLDTAAQQFQAQQAQVMEFAKSLGIDYSKIGAKK